MVCFSPENWEVKTLFVFFINNIISDSVLFCKNKQGNNNNVKASYYVCSSCGTFVNDTQILLIIEQGNQE